jgi:hypothetical protein
MTRLARCGSFHSAGSSASRFSSASCARALSTSKMPPQQPGRLLDFADDRLDFGAHIRNQGSAIRDQGSGAMDQELLAGYRASAGIDQLRSALTPDT